jgi:hypothetical protein
VGQPWIAHTYSSGGLLYNKLLAWNPLKT